MIKFVTCKAYFRILAEEEGLSGYDVQVLLKDIILDLFNYLLSGFNPTGSWDGQAVTVIVRSTRPRTTVDQANNWARHVRRAICEELNVPAKGYRLWLNVTDEFIRFIPYKDQEYENALLRVS